jgi:hypothetical protein
LRFPKISSDDAILADWRHLEWNGLTHAAIAALRAQLIAKRAASDQPSSREAQA